MVINIISLRGKKKVEAFNIIISNHIFILNLVIQHMSHFWDSTISPKFWLKHENNLPGNWNHVWVTTIIGRDFPLAKMSDWIFWQSNIIWTKSIENNRDVPSHHSLISFAHPLLIHHELTYGWHILRSEKLR